jgi:hypothetical protein
MKNKILKRYPKACLETCGDKYHKKGCYIKLRKEMVTNSEERNVLLDYNKKGEIIGIDLSYNSL